MYNDVVAQRRLDPTESPKPKARKFQWPWLAGVLIIVAMAMAGVLLNNRPKSTAKTTSSPIPKSLRQAVNFPIYYPDQSKLPAGYKLDAGSFAVPVNNGISYSVIYDNGKKIVFSIQTKPSDNELQSFQSNFIPLKIDFQTSLGQGSIGAYHGQTLASLPINDGPWVVVTAPADTNQDYLKQVLRSLKKD